MRWRRKESQPNLAPSSVTASPCQLPPEGKPSTVCTVPKPSPQGVIPHCVGMSAEQTKGSEGFQNFLLFAKPQLAGMARRGKAPALRRTCGSIPFRSNEKGLPGLNRKSFSFVKREKEMKMRGFANGVPLWNIFIIPAN